MPVDAGRMDAGPMPIDAGGPMDACFDAGFTGCECPPYPTTCTAPTANLPAFTPEATDVASQLFDVIACADSTLQIAM